MRESLPSRECGLKFVALGTEDQPHIVTPLAGVWIEMPFCCALASQTYASLPSRECGLKLLPGLARVVVVLSLPSRECGLKCGDEHLCAGQRGHSPRGSVD